MVVHAAGCNKQDSLMRDGLCGKLHGGPSQLLFALQQSWFRQPDIVFISLPFGEQSCIYIGRRAENRHFCLPHLHSTPLLAGFPSEYCHNVWYGKTRMAWLHDGEGILKMCSFVSTESTNVTDGQTDGQTSREAKTD